MTPCARQVPVGCSGTSAGCAPIIGLAQFVKPEGADGAVISATAGFSASSGDITDCIEEVCGAVGPCDNLPPARTDLHWNDLLKIVRHPDTVVLVASTAHVGEVARLNAVNADPFAVC